jgi:aspartyl-tRNA(Asn)/glutamyl-tRNA(Gln) amidotransferase subunit B
MADLALNCKIHSRTYFERKNYYYPDLPKNYQISQKAVPLGYDGVVEYEVNGRTCRVRILDLHLEEDAGKLLHPEEAGGRYSLVDLNRAGVPLLEIVCAPDMHSLEELQAFMTTIREILMYTGVSDCRMERGSLRFEAGVSVRPRGSDAIGLRIAEIKNLNSFKAVMGAVEYEIRRQIQALERGETLRPETRLWDERRGVTEAMRRKEEAQDYRYFPEPDLVPVVIEEERLERVRTSLPELPAARRRRMREQYGLSDYAVRVLTQSRELADFFEECVRLGGEPEATSHWVMSELLGALNEAGIELAEAKITPRHLAELLQLLAEGTITRRVAKEVFAQTFQTGRSPRDIVEREGLGQIADTSALESIIDRILATPDGQSAAENYRRGKKQALKFLMGQVMRETRGQANPQLVHELLEKKLA